MGDREGLDGYPYLKHLIQLWSGYWVKNISKMNEAVGMKNRFTVGGGGKQVVHRFNRQEFWICIGCILSAVNYGKKGHNIWIAIPKASCGMAPTKLRIYVCVKTDLYRVCCAHYCNFYIYAFH